MTESSFHFHKCDINSGCRCWYKGFSSKFWADSHALIYTHGRADEVRGSHCYSWWRWWSDILWVPHKVMTTPLLCNLPSVVDLLCLYGQCCVEMFAGSSCLVTNFFVSVFTEIHSSEVVLSSNEHLVRDCLIACFHQWSNCRKKRVLWLFGSCCQSPDNLPDRNCHVTHWEIYHLWCGTRLMCRRFAGVGSLELSQKFLWLNKGSVFWRS
jgi:hypothetical protein